MQRVSLLLKTIPLPPPRKSNRKMEYSGTYIAPRTVLHIMHRVPRVHHPTAQCISTVLFSADARRVTWVTQELRNFSCGLSMRHNIFYSHINGTNVISCQRKQLLVITHRWSVVNTVD